MSKFTITILCIKKSILFTLNVDLFLKKTWSQICPKPVTKYATSKVVAVSSSKILLSYQDFCHCFIFNHISLFVTKISLTVFQFSLLIQKGIYKQPGNLNFRNTIINLLIIILSCEPIFC